MANEIRYYILNFFHVLCVITTISFVAWCIKEYTLDHDYSETKFATFHQTLDDIYPSLTICDEIPFRQAKVEAYFRNHPVLGKTFGKSEKSYEQAYGTRDSKILTSYQQFLRDIGYSIS